MTRRSRRRPAAEPVAGKHLQDLEREMRKAWARRQARHGPQPEDVAAEDELARSPQPEGTTRRTT